MRDRVASAYFLGSTDLKVALRHHQAPTTTMSDVEHLRGSKAPPSGAKLMLQRATGLTSAVAYGGVSVSMAFINKYTLTVLPLSNVIMVLQARERMRTR